MVTTSTPAMDASRPISTVGQDAVRLRSSLVGIIGLISARPATRCSSRVWTSADSFSGERVPGAAYTPPEASYLAWVDCAGLGLGPEPAAVFLDRGRVALGRGLDFGAPGDGFVRVTIGTSTALLADIVDRMAAAAG